MRLTRTFALAVVGALAGAAAAAGSASAAGAATPRPDAAPRVQLRAAQPGARALPYVALKGSSTRISAGQAPRFKYSVEHLASGQKAWLERQFGSAGTWKEVAPLASTRLSTITAPKLPTLGRYAYRAVITSGRKTLRTSAQVPVFAYAKVQLAPICGGECSGTEQVGNQIFSYTDTAFANQYPSYQQNTAFGGPTSCRSLSVRFAGDDGAQGDGSTSYLEFVQQSSDPVYAQVGPGSIATVNVALDGGPLYIDLATTQGDDVALNITGSCYTVGGDA